jgi:UDP-glucose 4-epimerase
MDLAGTRLVVTGGAGFIGSHLVDHLVASGAERVVVVDDLSTGTEANLRAFRDRVDFVETDVRDREAAAAVAGADLVFHLAVRNVRASLGHPAENFSVNADGTLALLEAMRLGTRGRFLYVSSSEVYGIPADGTYAETTLAAPTTVYGAGKLAGELITLAYHRTYEMETAVVRPFNNFGPRSHFEGDSGEVIPKFILRALAGRPLLVHGDGNQTRDFMYAEDSARWLLKLALHEPLLGDVVNIGSGNDISINDLARTVLELTGSNSEVRHLDPRPGDLPRLRADLTKVRSMVPFSLEVGFSEGLKRTIDHFDSQDVEALLTAEVERNWT